MNKTTQTTTDLSTSTPATRLAALGQAMLGRPLPPLDIVAQIIGVSAEEVRELLAASTLEGA